MHFYNKLLQKFYLSSNPVTLSEHQGHSTGIKLYSLAVFSITASVKQIGSQVSQHMTMQNIYFIKWSQHWSLFWTLLEQNKFGMNFNKATGCGNTLKFIQINI